MKKIIILIMMLVMAAFSMAQRSPVADIEVTNSPFSNCSLGYIKVSNIRNVPSPSDLDGFIVTINRKPSGTDFWVPVQQSGAISNRTGSVVFIGLSPQEYQIDVYFAGIFEQRHSYYYRTVSYTNNCPLPLTITNIVPADYGCPNGRIEFNNPVVNAQWQNRGTGLYKVEGTYNCGCETYSYKLGNQQIPENPKPPQPANPIIRQINASSPLCKDGSVKFENSSKLNGTEEIAFLSPGQYDFPSTYQGACGAIPYNVHVEIGTNTPFNFDFTTIVGNPILNCARGSLLINPNNPPCVQRYAFRVEYFNGVNSNVIINTVLNPTDFPYKLANAQSGTYYITMDAIGLDNRQLSKTNIINIGPSGNTFTATYSKTDISNFSCNDGTITVTPENDCNPIYKKFWGIPYKNRFEYFLYDSAMQLMYCTSNTSAYTFDGLQPGSYTVRTKGIRYDAPSCPTSVTKQFTINMPPPFTLSASSTSTSYKYQDDGTITACMSNFGNDCNPHIYLYDNANNMLRDWNPDIFGPSNVPCQVVLVDYPAATYKLVAIAGGLSQTTYITVLDGPCNFKADNFVITRLPGNTYCNSIQVKYTGMGNGNYSFEYRNNISPYNAGAIPLNTSSGLYETDTDMPSGDYTIIGHYGDCTDSARFAFSANVLPVVTLSGSQCAGGVLTATTTGTGLESIIWKLDDNLVQTPASGWNTNGVTVAGGKERGSNLDQLAIPHKPFVDAAGNLYVAELGGRVSKWTPGATEGIIVATNVNASGIFVDAAGNVYVADRNRNQVSKWLPGDAINGIVVASGYSNGDQLSSPFDVYVDAIDNIYVSDHFNNRIGKWPVGAGVNEGSIYVNLGLPSIDQPGIPTQITFDGEGNLYISEYANHQVTKWAPDGTFIKTVAGGNGPGDGATRLNGPAGVAVDAFGNIFVSDENNQRVQLWKPGLKEGITISGTGTAGSGPNQFNNPVSICLDAAGNLYVADGYNERVQRFYLATNQFIKPTAEGSYTVAITDNNGCKATSDAFVINDQPNIVFTGKTTACTGIADTVTASGGTTYNWQPGNLTGATQAFTSTTAGVKVYKVTAANINNTCFDTDSFAIKTFTTPTVSMTGITCINNTFSAAVKRTSADNLLWSYDNNVAQTTNATWQPNATTVAGRLAPGQFANRFDFPTGLFVDSKNNLYVADRNNHRIQKFPPGFTQGITVAGGNDQGDEPTQLNGPGGVFVDRFGNIFIADAGNNRIQKWTPGFPQIVTTVAGGHDAGSATNQLDRPSSVLVDELGNIYVSDLGNHRVQKWAPGATEGVTVAGVSNVEGSENKYLSSPTGLALDGFGNLYVSENGNHRVSKWTPGAIEGIKVAGGESFGSGLDQLASPAGLFVDGLGNIFIADQSNQRIQKWEPGSTTGTRVAGSDFVSGTGPNELGVAADVFINANGDLFVADASNNRIQKFKKQIDTTYIPTAPGVYNVTVNDFNGCSAESNKLRIRDIQPGRPGVIIGQATNLCGGGIFNYSIAPRVNADFYTWTPPAGCYIHSGQGTTSVMMSVPVGFNTGTISVTASNSCSGNTGEARSLALSKLPSRPTSIIGPDTVMVNQTNMQFSIANNEANVLYNWAVPAGVIIVSGQGTNTITVNWGNRTGSLSVYARNSCGNSVIRYKKVTVKVATRSSNPEITDAVDATEEISLRLYPNPAKGLVNLSFNKQLKEQGSIVITDATGRTVLLLSNQSIYSNLPVNISNLKSGIYLVTVIANGQRIAAKLVVAQ